MSGVAMALAGAAAGAWQVSALARAVRRRAGGATLLLRLALVATVLLLAAAGGHLVAATLGWAQGFGVAGALWWRRLG